jgi:hypothetical protein
MKRQRKQKRQRPQKVRKAEIPSEDGRLEKRPMIFARLAKAPTIAMIWYPAARHTFYVTISALLIRYDRWLIESTGLEGGELRVFQVIVLVLSVILVLEIVRFFMRQRH